MKVKVVMQKKKAIQCIKVYHNYMQKYPYPVSPYQTMLAGGILNLNGRSVSTVNREDLK